ncbi:hypothetical protein [Janibacter cremeus]|uniref:hypothetical protein n=1 Tax=Janibacter cremeus TaxID=1285192 RepID=UPI001C8F26BD|nr:hypothetical protein [Janibacter cremeus]
MQFAVLADGHRVTLLDDRGWSCGGDDIWRRTSVEEIQETARVVVGPDEAYGRHSQADIAADHWVDLADPCIVTACASTPKNLANCRTRSSSANGC